MNEVIIEHDCTTPEQKRMCMKSRGYDPETDPYRDIPLPQETVIVMTGATEKGSIQDMVMGCRKRNNGQ